MHQPMDHRDGSTDASRDGSTDASRDASRDASLDAMDGIRPTPLPPFLPSTLPVRGDLSERAQSVARPARTGPVWRWWDEVNPLDDEPCAQPWANLGMVDLDAAEGRRLNLYLGRRYCSPCQVSWVDPPTPGDDLLALCWSCGEPADDAWPGTTPASSQPGHDGQQRHRPRAGVTNA